MPAAPAITKAVVLAAGRGTRMQRTDEGVLLSAEQERAAASGGKGAMPFGAHVFLDYVLTPLADAGITDVCLVVGPAAEDLRRHYARVPLTRLRVTFAQQNEPRGTADAVRAARELAGQDSFLVLNADNVYPESVLRALVTLGEPALPAFDPDALVRMSNIPRERIRAYALLRADAAGYLAEIAEKPDDATVRSFGAHAPVSMNVFAFPPAIFDACDRVQPSARGELEIADALRIAMDTLGVRFRLVPVAEGVIDLSHRSDVSDVSRRLAAMRVNL